MIRLTDVVKHLLIINIIVYVGSQLLLPDARILSLYYPESEFFKPFQVVTHMFMHALPQKWTDTHHIQYVDVGISRADG